LKVSICVSTFNRKEKTAACIESVLAAAPDEWEIEWVIVDAGSTDGTIQAISDFRLAGKLIQTDSNSFWSRSMNFAMSSISPDSEYVLLLNDDVNLEIDSLFRLTKLSSKIPNAILVGQTRDPLSRKLTYGGYLKIGQHPLRLTRLVASAEALEVDTFNANIVFIPRIVIEKVGIIDHRFEHGYGDLDYGYRAKRFGIKMYSLPGFLGACADDRDSTPVTYSRFQKLKYVLEIKRLPWRSQLLFTKRYGGFFWPIYFFAPYLNILVFNRLPISKNHENMQIY